MPKIEKGKVEDQSSSRLMSSKPRTKCFSDCKKNCSIFEFDEKTWKTLIHDNLRLITGSGPVMSRLHNTKGPSEGKQCSLNQNMLNYSIEFQEALGKVG